MLQPDLQPSPFPSQLPASKLAGRPASKRVNPIRDGKKLAAGFEAARPALKPAGLF